MGKDKTDTFEISERLVVERKDQPIENFDDDTDTLLVLDAVRPYTRDVLKSSSNACPKFVIWLASNVWLQSSGVVMFK